MEPLNFQQFASQQEGQNRENWFRINLETRVAAYNAVKRDEDGTRVAAQFATTRAP